jgi:hypothetical protein
LCPVAANSTGRLGAPLLLVSGRISLKVVSRRRVAPNCSSHVNCCPKKSYG